MLLFILVKLHLRKSLDGCCSSLWSLGKEKFGDCAELVCTSVYITICKVNSCLLIVLPAIFVFFSVFLKGVQFGFLGSRGAGCVPSEKWGFGALGLGFWALRSHSGLFPSGSCSKRICPSWNRVFISFLDVRLDKRKGRFSQSCSLYCWQGHFCLASWGDFLFGDFFPFGIPWTSGELFLPVCSVLED